MANRAQGYGFTAEINSKIDAKYSAKDEAEIADWLADLGLGRPSAPGKDAFQEFLQDGQVLCALANKLQPGAINRVHDIGRIKIAAMKSMKCQENISFFLKWCRAYGLNEADIFQTVYLFEGKDLSAVQLTLFKVGGTAIKKGFNGPTIGVKVADQNKRNFTEAQLNAGKNIASQQMGNNKGASQSGMTGYGQGRQIIDHANADYKADTSTLGLRSGTNAAQKLIDGNQNYGARRQIMDDTSREYNADYNQPGQQMGNNQGANVSGSAAPGTRRQIM